MLPRRSLILVLILLFLPAVIGACRRQEEPTPTPPPATTEAEVEPTDTTEPAATPDAEAEALSFDWPPQVVYSSPAPGEEVTLDGAITIRFDQPMNQESVEAAFDAQGVGGGPVDGRFSWPRPDTLVFTPVDPLGREARYRVQIGRGAEGRNGQPLLEPIAREFQTVGFLEVGQVIPADGTDDVQTDAAVTVLFNRPVVPLVATGQQADLPQPLTLNPPVAGAGEWISTSIFRFVPDEPLAGATTYQATVAGGLEDITGGVLADDFTWRFTTLSPDVVTIAFDRYGTAGTDPSQSALDIIPTSTMTVTFNMPMDRASTEAAIALTPAATLDFAWQENDRVAVLTPADPLQLETTYELSIGDSARSANGAASLNRDTRTRFATVPFPAVRETNPRDGSLAEQWQTGVNIQFASPMNFETLDGRIVVEPAPEEDIEYFYDDYGFNLYLNFELERNTEYTVTIPGDAADPYGNTLGEDYVFSFTTPGFEPLASFNLPQLFAQLSRSYPTEVGIIYRNVSAVEVDLYDMAAGGELPIDALSDPYRFRDQGAPGDWPLLQTWSLPAESGQDQVFTTTLALADGDILPNGLYYLTVTAPEIISDNRWWQNQGVVLVVADTNVVVKEMFDAVYVWTTDLATGQPAAGRRVTLYNNTLYGNPGALLGMTTTDANGLARFDYEPAENYLGSVFVVSGAPGAAGFGVSGSQWNATATPWQLGAFADTSNEQPYLLYLITDRPIYRPGDTVHYRGVLRDTNFGRYNLPGLGEVTISTSFFSNFDSGSVEYNPTLAVDAGGGFSGEMVLPDAALGTYNLSAQSGNIYLGERQFTVAEYRAPEFLVTVTPETTDLLRGQPTTTTVLAEYFFGGSAAGLDVNWTVYDTTYRLFWEGPPFYSFADDANFFYRDLGPFGGPFGEGFYGAYVTGGSGQTGPDGRFVIELPAGLLEEVEAGSRDITVEAVITDVSGFPVAARTAMTFHAAEVYVGVAPADYLGTAGLDTEVNLITTDWDGQPVPDQNVEVVIYQREWRPERAEEFSQYYTRWTPVDTEIERQPATTGSDGEATISFVPPKGGEYLIVATVTDDGGRQHTSSTSLWVADENFVGWQVDPRDSGMELVADRTEYRVGDTARILVQSPFAGPVSAWLTIERGTLIEQRLITLQSNSDTVEIPITADLAPNAFVTIVAVKGVDETNPYADIRLGIVELPVAPEQLGLSVILTSQSDLTEPGGTAVFDVAVSDFSGNGVAADVTLALVDLAVLTLKTDNVPPILEAFYGRQPYRSQIGSALFYSGEGLEIEIPLMQGGLGGGGGGFEQAASVALDEDAQDGAEDIRADFRDTAYWEARLTTDANGRATIEIPLPDNITTWRLTARAVTAETLVGQNTADIVATLPLLVRPVTPRFFTVGDRLMLGAIVNNNTGADLEVAVSLEADGVTLEGDPEITVNVPANGSQLVQWPVTVNDVQWADLTFRASGGDFSDAARPRLGTPPDQLLPVYRYDAEDVVGTSGVLDEAGRRVEAILLPPGVDTRAGEVAVNLSASLAAALTQALDAVNYPYPEYTPICAHAAADRLLPNVATARALSRLDLDAPELQADLDVLITEDIGRLESQQKANGGWGWCDSDQTDDFLSAYILLALAKADETGYDVSQDTLDKGLNYLGRQIEPAARLSDRWQVNRQAFFLYVLAENEAADSGDMDALFDEHRSLMDPYARALLALAYELSGGRDNLSALLADLNDLAIVSATGAHWEDAEPDWNNLASDARGTAIVLGALARLDTDNPLAERAARWLMVARTAEGHWPTGQDNAWSILALTDWMAATGELEANFAYELAVNGATVAEGAFTSENVTESEQVAVPIGDLAVEDVNFFDFQRGEGGGRLYYTAHLDSFIDAHQVSAVSRGVTVQRLYYDAACDPEEQECQPITEIASGQQVRVALTIIAPHDLLYAVIEDRIPAGAEAIDPGLETSAVDNQPGVSRMDQDYRFGYWGWWFFNRIEFRDERVVFLSDFLPAGTYQYTYTLQAAIPGDYQVMPATARQEFMPEVFGRSEGLVFRIVE